MYEQSIRIAKKLEAIADEIDNGNFEFDTNAESDFMDSVRDICMQQYEMILMYVGKLKKSGDNELEK
jgi:hypothetical protein